MLIKGNAKDILEKAQIAEKNYNWIKAADFYQSLIDNLKNDKKIAEAAEISQRLGFAYEQAALIAESSSEYSERSMQSIKTYKDASNLYNQFDNKASELECEAEISFVKADIATSHSEVLGSFNKAIKLFSQSSELFFKDRNHEGYARTSSRALLTKGYLSFFCMDLEKKKQIVNKGKDEFEKAWEISKEIGKVEFMTDLLLALGFFGLSMIEYTAFWQGEHKEKKKKFTENLITKIEYALKLAEKDDNYEMLGILFSIEGNQNCYLGVYHTDNELQQRKYVRNGLELMERGLDYVLKTNNKLWIIFNIFWATFFSILGGKYGFIQKRISNYVQLCEKIKMVFSKSYNFEHLFAKLLLPFYNYQISQRIGEVLKPDQRISDTKKTIKYANEFLEFFYNPTSGIWIHTFFTAAYLILINSYSFLTPLAQSREEQNEYKKMLIHITKQCERMVKIDNIGLNKVNTYAVISQAYQTLARITENKEEKINMLKIAVHNLEKNLEYFNTINSKHMLGTHMIELGILTKNIETIKKARDIFLNMLNESNDKSFFYYAAIAQEHIAHIEDRLGNHTTSAIYYEDAGKSRKEQLKYIEYPPLQNVIKDTIKYDEAWKYIEEAKAYHKRENHLKAKDSYQKAYLIQKELPNYNYEASYYEAWASLEEAEHLSKQEKQQEAIEQYEKTKSNFELAIKALQQAIEQDKREETKERIKKLEKVAKIRIDYCSARINVENARSLGKEGEHVVAAEKFALAAFQFRNVCSVFKVESERKELEAIYYLCRAWESMELAENYEDPDRFTDVANLFIKASNLFTGIKYKLLASGNSAFCQALEYGCKFDETIETEIKAQLYSKVKKMLNKAATSYRKGGFQNGTEWVLATSTYFDAVWNLLRANDELNLDERKKFLSIGSGYLRSAADLFRNAGYKDKEKDVTNHLHMVEKEEKILLSAVSTITKPSISRSTIGIVAPTCPIEISNSTDLSEIQAITEESFRTLERKQEESNKRLPQLTREQPVLLLIIAEGGVLIFTYAFIEESKIDDELLGSFLTAFNSFSSELFSEGLDRAKFGQYSVVMEPIRDLTVCYLFKGQTYPAKLKLTQFAEHLQEDTSIWDILNKFSKTSQVLEINDIPSLESLISEIFLNNNQ